MERVIPVLVFLLQAVLTAETHDRDMIHCSEQH